MAAAAIFLSCCKLLQTPKGLLHHIKVGGSGVQSPGAPGVWKLTVKMIRDIDVIRKRKDYYDSLEQMDKRLYIYIFVA